MLAAALGATPQGALAVGLRAHALKVDVLQAASANAVANAAAQVDSSVEATASDSASGSADAAHHAMAAGFGTGSPTRRLLLRQRLQPLPPPPAAVNDSVLSAPQVSSLVDDLRLMYALPQNTSAAAVASVLSRSARATASNNPGAAAAAQDGDRDDDDDDHDDDEVSVAGPAGKAYDLTTVEGVEAALRSIAAAARRLAGTLRRMANDAVTAGHWAKAEEMHETYSRLERQAEVLSQRAACSSRTVLRLGRADSCALPTLQQLAREQLEVVADGERVSMQGGVDGGDSSFRGLRKIFDKKMRLAVAQAGRSLADDRRVLQVLNILQLLDKLIEMEAKLRMARAQQQFTRGRLLQGYFDDDNDKLKTVRRGCCSTPQSARNSATRIARVRWREIQIERRCVRRSGSVRCAAEHASSSLLDSLCLCIQQPKRYLLWAVGCRCRRVGA
jgi:hypothetical protein